MGFFYAILSAFLVADLIVWRLSARALGRTVPRTLRWALHGFFVGQIVFMGLLLWGRNFQFVVRIPVPFYILFYVWHVLVAPVALIGGLLGVAGEGMVYFYRFFRPKPAALSPCSDGLTRREFLGSLAALTPPLLTFSLSAVASLHLSDFRVRRLTVVLPTLPPELDGMTIVQLADLHVGQFTQGHVLKEIVEATNRLQPDLTVFAGDLINSVLEMLPEGIAMLRGIHSPLVLCEGNHDVGLNRGGFERNVKASGLRLLLNEAVTLRIRDTPVQILGIVWDGPQNWQNHGDESGLAASCNEVLRLRDPEAFAILLAHHPHAWDYCGDVALTLSGHTHGGQLMLDQDRGFGPMMFRYWSGLYTRPAGAGLPTRALVVSNGVGNWFPLRTRAPAEIVHLTLRRT